MDVPSIEGIARSSGLRLPGAASAPGAAGASGFAEALGKALSSVNRAQQHAEAAARQFQLNDPNVTLEESMIAMQTANVSFQALVQVRNRLLSAYHEIMNLQV